jgi:vitamin B12 transporter
VLLVLSGATHAQTVLPELLVISPSLTPIEASKTGSAVTVMTGEEARSSGFTQLSDVVRTFPGVAVSQSGARGSLTQFRVRGTEANHLLVMIDGVPANAVTDGEYDFADIPLDDIERIELLRGPQSGLYGANAHSGVLTIETKSGRGLAKPEFTAKLEGGTQRSAEGSASFRGAWGPVYGSTTASYATTNGFNIARDGSENDGAKRFAVTSKIGVDLTPYLNVEGFIRHFHRQADIDPQNFATGLVFDRRFDQNIFDETLARVEGTLKLFDDRWIQSLKATSSRQNHFAFDADPFTPPPGLASSSTGTSGTLSYKSSLLLDSNFAGGEKHRITGLVESRREHFSFDSIFLFGPDLDAARNGHDRTTNGVGGEYVLDLLRTGTTISVAQRQDFNEPFQDEYTWRYSISQKLGMTGARLHSSIGRGVTNPSFIEQFGFLTSTFVPNPNLVPESSIGWDAGWEQQFWNGRVLFDVTYFNSRLQNEIVLKSLPTFQSTVDNLAGTSSRQGVEVTGKFRPVDWLTLAGTYTFTDARDDKGLPEIRRPPHAASGSATVLFLDGRGKATVNVIYNGQMPDTIFTFPSQSTTLNAYTLVGGMISYDTTPWSTVYVRAENVFNQRYEEVYSYRSPGAAVYAGVKVRTN